MVKEELRDDELNTLATNLAYTMPNHTKFDDKKGPTDSQIMKAMKKYFKDLYKYSTTPQKKQAIKIVKKVLSEGKLNEIGINANKFITMDLHSKAPKGKKLHILGTKDGSDQRDFLSLGSGNWKEKRTGKKISSKELLAIVSKLKNAKIFYEGKLNEAHPIDKVLAGYPATREGGIKNYQVIVSEPMNTRQKTDMIKRAKQVGYKAKPNNAGGVTIFVKEAVDLKKHAKFGQTGVPFPQEEPNTFAFVDYKKWAYKYRNQYKKDVENVIKKHGRHDNKLFKLATSWWVAYDKKTNKGAFSNIKNDSKFGRALIVMMRAVGLVFDKTQHYLGALQEETTMKKTQLIESNAIRIIQQKLKGKDVLYRRFDKNGKPNRDDGRIFKVIDKRGVLGKGKNKEFSIDLQGYGSGDLDKFLASMLEGKTTMKKRQLNEFNVDYHGKGGLKKFETYITRNIGHEFGINDKGFLKKIMNMVIKQSRKELAKNVPDWWNGTGSYAGSEKYGVNHVDKSKAGLGRGWLTEGTINEREFVIIDPRGNAKPVGMKAQGAQYLKKMGGPKKGYHMVLKKNADKARRAIEKNGGNATNSKIQNIMFDLMYEITESSAEWAKTLKKLALQKKLDRISSKDKETLLKIVRMVKTANEAKLDKEKFTDPSQMKEKKKKSMILGDKEKTNESQNPLRYPKNK